MNRRTTASRKALRSSADSFRKKRRVPPARLRRTITVSELPFKTTESPNLARAKGPTIFHQSRAKEALDFALNMKSKGYNLYVAGLSGTGKHNVTRNFVASFAKKKPEADDWCYVNNFRDPNRPLALAFPAGQGRRFAEMVNFTVQTMQQQLPATFDSKEFNESKQAVKDRTQNEKNRFVMQIDAKAKALDFQVQSTPTGVSTFPLVDGNPITPTQYQKLAVREQKRIESKKEKLNLFIRGRLHSIHQLDKQLHADLTDLGRRTAEMLLGAPMQELFENFGGDPDVSSYLEAFAVDAVENYSDFLTNPESSEGSSPIDDVGPPSLNDPLLRYRVNVLVDRKHEKGAPVIEETNPSYYNLVGRIEKTSVLGTTYSDFTHIKAGSLLEANGGYLLIDADELFWRPGVWAALARALIHQKLQIEDIPEAAGYIPTSGLRPQSIPLDLKVILYGSHYVFSYLYQYEDNFKKIFKVRADFEYEVPLRKKSLMDYGAYIRRLVEEEGLKHFEASGVAAVAEFGLRLSEHQGKLSMLILNIADLAREASFWSTRAKTRRVSRKHVQKALEARNKRSNLEAEKMTEMIAENVVFLDTAGFVTGQINGLAIYEMGDYSFGRPSRITAATFLGEEGIVDIERRVKYAGTSYEKGVLIISAFLGERFAQDKPLSLTASLCFEQSYAEIDGDSASSTELYALLSSLSGAPIDQGVAVTGSVNQKGEVQPIGGINEKIEGFFNVCKAKRLTGKQGVMMPASNLDHLMLSEEVVAAVRAGRFNVWAVATIDEGIEVLTGVPAGKRRRNGSFPEGTLNRRVDDKLREMALQIRNFGDPPTEEEKKKAAKKKKKKRSAGASSKKTSKKSPQKKAGA